MSECDDLKELEEPAVSGRDDVRPARQEASNIQATIGEVGGAGLLAAGAAYALGYSAQSGYYNAFGLTPEQAGVDRVSALLRITPLAALFGVLTVLVVAAMLAIGRWVQTEFLDWLPFAWSRRLPAYVVLPTLLLIPIVSLSVHAPDMYAGPDGSTVGDYELWQNITAGALVWLLVAWVWWIFSRILGQLAATAAAGITVIATACIALNMFATAPAQNLRDQGYPQSSIRLMMIGLPQSYAEVRWKRADRAPRDFVQHPDRIYLVLGEKTGQYLLYDYCESVIYPVEAQDAYIVRMIPNKRSALLDPHGAVNQRFSCPERPE